MTNEVLATFHMRPLSSAGFSRSAPKMDLWRAAIDESHREATNEMEDSRKRKARKENWEKREKRECVQI